MTCCEHGPHAEHRFRHRGEQECCERPGGHGTEHCCRGGHGAGHGAGLGIPYGAGVPRGPALKGPPSQVRYADSPWRAGQAVRHDDYGSGVIIKISPTPSSGPLVVVRFETGKQAQFFPQYSSKLEVLKE